MRFVVMQECFLERDKNEAIKAITYEDQAFINQKSDEISAIKELASRFVINFTKANAATPKPLLIH